MKSSDTVQTIRGVGDVLADKLHAIGIDTLADLLEYFPRGYNDYSQITPIDAVEPGTVTIEAKISDIKGRYARRGLHITEASARDDTGSLRVVWFNQPYRAKSIQAGRSYYLSGDFQLRRQRFSLQNPIIEQVSDTTVHTARIVPVYKESRGITSVQIRKLIDQCQSLIKHSSETLPESVLQTAQLLSRSDALQQVHFPDSSERLQQARHRFGFEEVFQLTLASLMNKHELMQDTAVSVPFEQSIAQSIVQNLPFQLTEDQRKAAWQIYQDMQKTQPMNRLLEGDVGSGKTVVAAMAAAMAIKHGFQVAFMAPTEILARQHEVTMRSLLAPLSMDKQIGLLTGSLSASIKKQRQQQIANNQLHCIIGTHALISDAVTMHNLGLVIVDEQHRFGVEQRHKVQKTVGYMPHILHMTATPIPRSLALTLYGELDISVLAEKPAGRKPIQTTIHSPNSRAQLYNEVERQLRDGRQLFVVCPLIEDSEVLKAQSATEVHKRLKQKDLKLWRIGLLHGKLSHEQKTAVMQDFLTHKLDVLVSTTVIEVGVDVPNATMMIIESADRFGLAQIHQLRGRVGRSELQSYCYLVLSDSKRPSRRIRAVAEMNDGFKLAELDLELRGPGAIYGTYQHGALDLRVASLADTKLIAAARNAAQEFIDSGQDLLQYKHLYSRVKSLRSVTNLQ
jgi:ATP-dependent DNA helicase RecG